MSKRVFVTGASGLLGRALMDCLLENGHEVVAMVRRPDSLDCYPNREWVDCVIGDMESVSSFADRLKTCDVVMHLAAFHREYLEGKGDASKLESVNVSGTMELIKAADTAEIERFIFVSSAGVMRRTGKSVNELSAFDLDTQNAYFASKVKAEKAIDAYLASHKSMPILIARPTMMLGPQDPGPTVAGQFIRNFMYEKNAVVLPGYAVIIDSRDVAKALVAMIERGSTGERFILGGPRYSFLELNERLEKICGVPMPSPRPPYIVTWLVMAIRGLLGMEVPLRHTEIRYMQRLIAPDNTKMIMKLDVTPRPIQETLTDTVDWFRSKSVSS